MRRVRTLLALLLVLPAISTGAGRAHALEPLVVGWERFFRLEWDVGRRGERPVLNGSFTNNSVYTVRAVQVLVEALDPNGGVVAQEVARVPGHVTPSTRVSFQAAAQASPSTTYRVRVFAFDPVDGCGD